MRVSHNISKRLKGKLDLKSFNNVNLLQSLTFVFFNLKLWPLGLLDLIQLLGYYFALLFNRLLTWSGTKTTLTAHAIKNQGSAFHYQYGFAILARKVNLNLSQGFKTQLWCHRCSSNKTLFSKKCVGQVWNKLMIAKP